MAMECDYMWKRARLDFGKCAWESIITLETDYKFDDLVETPSVHCSCVPCGIKGRDIDNCTV